MSHISLIAAVDVNFGLGKNNQLLCHLPADLKHFKEITLGKPVIMGKKTFLSIGRPLPKRQNIVLTAKQNNFSGVEIAASLNEALKLASEAPEIMIIGGASVYQQALAFASNLYLTLIEHQFNADVFFPRIDLTKWTCLSKISRPCDANNPYAMTFYHYQKPFEISK